MPTRKLYRVFPWVEDVEEEEPGSALYVPRQGAGRFDNPKEYAILYASNTAEGAIAEAFGRFPRWTSTMLAGIPTLTGSRHALAVFKVDETLEFCDLDDPKTLLEWGLRPSDVVNREYQTTQATALRIFLSSRYQGLSWWSYYHPVWNSVGIWRRAEMSKWTGIQLLTVAPLSITDNEIRAAAQAIVRMIE